MISVIDYGMGNLGSVVNMFNKIGIRSILVNKPEEVSKARKILLPGVGTFDNAISKLNHLSLFAEIIEKANSGTPILGICLGMQLLGTESEEGNLPGLNLIPGKIKRFPALQGFKVPHMGWNNVASKEQILFNGLENNRFYFVHSYFFEPSNIDHSFGMTDYGIRFTSYIKKDNILGVQFHPEKSHKYGMQILKNFAAI